MSEKSGANRRLVLRASVGIAAAACAPAQGQDTVPTCGVSFETDAGPFFPPGDIPTRWDLIAAGGAPSGQRLYVTGTVHTQTCAPLGRAVATLWQADANGRYDHPGAQNSGPLDPGFLYFGRFQTLPNGAYLFRTIMPAPYQFRGLRRAPHIHFAFEHPEHGRLITELYFNRPDDAQRRRGDQVWAMRDEDTRDTMILDLREPSSWSAPHPIEPDALWCQYDITLPR